MGKYTYTKDSKTGRIVDAKKGDPYKGVRKEK